VGAKAIVAGAGLAGLSAARHLAECGFEVLLLEASLRAGGQAATFADLPCGILAEAGPDRIGADEPEAALAARSLGVPSVPAPGDRFLRYRGKTVRLPDGVPAAAAFESLPLPTDVKVALAPGGELERALRPHFARIRRPLWRTADPRTEALDKLSFAQFLSIERLHFVDALRILDLFHLPRRGIAAKEASALAAIADLFPLLYEPPPGPPLRIEGGMEALVRAHVARIEALGGALRLSSPVASVRSRIDGVEIAWTGPHAGSATAAAAVLALPPRALARIAFEPALDSEKVAVLARATAGSALRVAFAFDAPYWQPLGFHGAAEVLGDGFFGRIAIDGNPRRSGPATATVTAYGPEAEALAEKPPEERRRLALEAVEEVFPRARAHLIAGGDREAAAIGSARPALFPGDVYRVAEASGRPCGRLHFAGAHVDGGHGIEAAIASGRAAAREAAIGALGPTRAGEAARIEMQSAR
jgi:monoamine oxidase